ncbi:MAG: hypothetical protein ACI3Z0_11250 [Candidatus Cryptobacteroides sp.]
MRNIFIQTFLPLLFIFYISGITLFPHTHIVDGISIVHSHPNPGTEHQVENSYVTIQMLSHFQACGIGEGVHLPRVEEFALPELAGLRDISLLAQQFYRYFGLRAPPGA